MVKDMRKKGKAEKKSMEKRNEEREKCRKRRMRIKEGKQVTVRMSSDVNKR